MGLVSLKAFNTLTSIVAIAVESAHPLALPFRARSGKNPSEPRAQLIIHSHPCAHGSLFTVDIRSRSSNDAGIT